MIYYIYFILGFLVLLCLISLFNVITAPLIKNGPKPRQFPWVSVLVPARNEEHNIATCLKHLCEQDYPNLEIVVLDDHSTDDTAQVVKQFLSKDDRIRLIIGESLPPGWNGKNWACHQLSQTARGQILIFTDADNIYSSDAISRTVGWIQKLDLALFSAFPQQITRSLPEKLVVPVIDMFVYSYLPLWLTFGSKFPSLAAANGQWLAFTTAGYRRIGGHQAAKGQIVEDTFLARLAKKRGEKIITSAGTDAVFGRMYHNLSEVWWGFSKNAFGLLGYSTPGFFVFLFLTGSVYIAPYLLILFSNHALLAGITISLNLVIRGMLALKYRQPFWTSILLHPIGILLTITIGINSLVCYYKGNIEWKGRRVSFRPMESEHVP